jgi:hypothetical protein
VDLDLGRAGVSATGLHGSILSTEPVKSVPLTAAVVPASKGP